MNKTSVVVVLSSLGLSFVGACTSGEDSNPTTGGATTASGGRQPTEHTGGNTSGGSHTGGSNSGGRNTGTGGTAEATGGAQGGQGGEPASGGLGGMGGGDVSQWIGRSFDCGAETCTIGEEFCSSTIPRNEFPGEGSTGCAALPERNCTSCDECMPSYVNCTCSDNLFGEIFWSCTQI